MAVAVAVAVVVELMEMMQFARPQHLCMAQSWPTEVTSKQHNICSSRAV